MLQLLSIIAGLVIALGFTSIPVTPWNVGRGPIWVDTFVWLIAISPLLPLMIALINATMNVPLSKLLSRSLAILFGIGGVLISLLMAVTSGVGAIIALIHGLALTIALTSSILLLSVPRGTSILKAKPLLAMIVPMIVALWSFTSLAAIVSQAKNLAGNRTFCLAPHSQEISGIQSFAQLRGLSFYSTLSGYKESSRWYFHGILIINTDEEQEIYNWSPRLLRFNKVEHPKRFIATPRNACTPREGFLKALPVW